MPQLVRPVQAFNSVIDGGHPNGIILGPSDILRDDNPHVLAHPELFEPVRTTYGADLDQPETATARPGEKRAVKR